MYFGSFPILIIVFCLISTFVILLSNFSNLFNISSNRVSILLNSILYVFIFLLEFELFPQGDPMYDLFIGLILSIINFDHILLYL